MRGSAIAAAVAALAMATTLLAGCVEAPDASAEAEPDAEPPRMARGARGGDGEDDDRTYAPVGSASGGPTQPGTYPLSLDVPPGGADDVGWFLDVVPLAAFTLDGVEGPGCATTGWYTGVTASGTMGGCSPLAAGPHEWSFTLNAPVASYRVEVLGLVGDPAHVPSNATEP